MPRRQYSYPGKGNCAEDLSSSPVGIHGGSRLILTESLAFRPESLGVALDGKRTFK